MDAFDRFRQWADKPLDSYLTIPAELHRAVMELAPEDRRDRAKVIEAAAHEHEAFLDPVGDPETQNVAVEADHRVHVFAVLTVHVLLKHLLSASTKALLLR